MEMDIQIPRDLETDQCFTKIKHLCLDSNKIYVFFVN